MTQTETQNTNPAEVPTLNPEQFVCPDIKAGLHEVLYGKGLAVIERAGVPDEEREAFRAQRWQDNSNVAQVRGSKEKWTTRFLLPPSGEDTLPSTLRNSLVEAVGAHTRFIHPVYNVYTPGNVIPKHVDFSDDSLADEPAIEGVSLLYVISGQKYFQAWPDGATRPQTNILQTPDMLIMFRGGSMAVDGEVRPAIWHGVPSQETHCETVAVEMRV